MYLLNITLSVCACLILAITPQVKDRATQIYVPSINAGWLPAFAYFYEIHCNMQCLVELVITVYTLKQIH